MYAAVKCCHTWVDARVCGVEVCVVGRARCPSHTFPGVKPRKRGSHVWFEGLGIYANFHVIYSCNKCPPHALTDVISSAFIC